MKRIVFPALLLASAFALHAQTVEIQRAPLGSGEPGGAGFEQAAPVTGNLYHAPQYLPGFPTAAMIWPRVVPVRCTQEGTTIRCEGYEWSPAMGRAEYLFFMPVIVQETAPK